MKNMLGSDWQCNNCGYIYRNAFAPPESCPHCGGMFYKVGNQQSSVSSGNFPFNLIGAVIGLLILFYYKIIKFFVTSVWNAIQNKCNGDKKDGQL